MISLQNNYIYQLTKGILNIVIVCLTMSIIDIFHKQDGDENQGTGVLKIQVFLIFLSMMEQSVGIVVRGFSKTFKSILLTFEIVITLIALLIGMIFVSFDNLELLLSYEKTSLLFKIFALATIGKTISVIMFLRIIREIRIVLDVLVNSAIFLTDVIGMLGIVMLLFSSVGITIFGGVLNSKSLATFEGIMGDKPSGGSEYLNFNDYLNSFTTLFTAILSGWQDPLKMLSFSNPNRSMYHNYFFVAFFICANLFLLNVLIGFIIDNIVAYLSEDIVIETPEHKEFKQAMKSSLIGQAFDYIKDKTINTFSSNKEEKDLDGIVLTEMNHK